MSYCNLCGHKSPSHKNSCWRAGRKYPPTEKAADLPAAVTPWIAPYKSPDGFLQLDLRTAQNILLTREALSEMTKGAIQ